MIEIANHNPDRIEEIAGGYKDCQVLLTANRLGFFAALGNQSLNVDQIAGKLETDLRATRILCDALAALSLLEKEKDLYRNSSLVKESLLPDSPNPKMGILWHSAKLYERWGKLFDVVKSGQPVPDEVLDPNLIGDEKMFASAMADVGRISARQLAETLDLHGAKSMLDVGGGPGLYAIEFVRRFPELRAVVFDNEKTVAIAGENAKQAGLEDRVSVKGGDIFEDSFGEGYDFILLSNVVHIYSGEENAKLVKKCVDSLAPDGRVCIKDFLLDPDRTSPTWGALFAVNMLVNTEKGNCYTLEEVHEWIERAGLQSEADLNVAHHSRLVIGVKK